MMFSNESNNKFDKKAVILMVQESTVIKSINNFCTSISELIHVYRQGCPAGVYRLRSKEFIL